MLNWRNKSKRECTITNIVPLLSASRWVWDWRKAIVSTAASVFSSRLPVSLSASAYRKLVSKFSIINNKAILHSRSLLLEVPLSAHSASPIDLYTRRNQLCRTYVVWNNTRHLICASRSDLWVCSPVKESSYEQMLIKLENGSALYKLLLLSSLSGYVDCDNYV